MKKFFIKKIIKNFLYKLFYLFLNLVIPNKLKKEALLMKKLATTTFVFILFLSSFTFLQAQDANKTTKIINYCGARFNMFLKDAGIPIDISPLCTGESSSEVFFDFKDFGAVIDKKMVVRIIFFSDSKNFSYKGITMQSSSNDIEKKLGTPNDKIERANGNGYLWEYPLDEIFSSMYFWFDPDMKLEKVSVELK